MVHIPLLLPIHDVASLYAASLFVGDSVYLKYHSFLCQGKQIMKGLGLEINALVLKDTGDPAHNFH